MPPPPTALTDSQKLLITAALFRREPLPQISITHSISLARLRRFQTSLATHGTLLPPKLPPSPGTPVKKLGRPTVLPAEVSTALYNYVLEHPLSILEDMQSFLQEGFGVKASRASISRRLWELGFERGMIRKGVRGLGNANVSETRELAVLGEGDVERIRREVGRRSDGGEMVVVVGGQESRGGGGEELMEMGGLLQRGLFIVRDDGSGVPVPASLYEENDETGLDEGGAANGRGVKGGVYNKRGKYAWLQVNRSAGQRKVLKSRGPRKPKQRTELEQEQEQAADQEQNDINGAEAAAAEQIREELEDAAVMESRARRIADHHIAAITARRRNPNLTFMSHSVSHLPRSSGYAVSRHVTRQSAPDTSGGMWSTA